VAGHLSRIVSAVAERCAGVDAIVLTGGFGRGEGGVFRDADDRYRAVNDYDLMVVSARDCAPELRQLGAELAGELGVDFVDLAWSDGAWEKLPLTVFHYDLKYGSQVLLGDPAVLDRLPQYAAADIPVLEAVRLMLNRLAGLLSGLRGGFFRGEVPRDREWRYLVNQITKAWLAVGDTCLIRWGGYECSYRRRGERLRWLGPGAGLEAPVVARLVAAYDFKCLPDYTAAAVTPDDVRLVWRELSCALAGCLELLTGQRPESLNATAATYLSHLSADAQAVGRDNEYCRGRPGLDALLRSDFPPGLSVRHAVYAALMHVAEIMPGSATDAAPWDRALARLRSWFNLPDCGPASAEAWEILRAFVVKAWFATCH
jgi:hypothetical protein